MKTELTKTPNKAIWTLNYEWVCERITITASGTARLIEENGGWGGAWDERQYRGAAPRLLPLPEAAALLEAWGVDDDDIAAVRALSPYAAAFLP